MTDSALLDWVSRRFATLVEALRWLREHEQIKSPPVFGSHEAALFWAFRADFITVKNNSAYQMAGRTQDDLWGTEETRLIKKAQPLASRDPDLIGKPGGWDAIGQQAMILAFVRRLPKHEHLYVCARYAVGDERKAATRALRDVVMPLLTQHIRPRFVVYMLICRYFGRLVKLDDLAAHQEYMYLAKKAFKEARHAVNRLEREVYSVLRDIGAGAEGKLHEYCRTGGLIK